jgi:UDP-N-acetylglucosamine diphosphorylase/glucosamine-1-phosphate N-acetyltransferase
MHNSALLIFDDGRGLWGPMTDLRPVFDLRTGALTTRQRIERVAARTASALVVPPDQAAAMSPRQSGIAVYAPLSEGQWLAVNGRWPGVAHAQRVQELPVGTALVQGDGQLIAAYLEHTQARGLMQQGGCKVPPGVQVELVEGNVLLDRPWQIMDGLDTTLRADLDATELPDCDCAKHGAVRFGDHRVSVASDVWLQPGVVFNATQGPIVVESRALIGAQSVLEGPCFIGSGSQVSCHAHIRPHTVIGPMCKVAGEVSHSVIQGYSNKGHHGYLGHALVGQWVNLGAATNVSNLKNTYGPVRVQLAKGTAAEDTGRQYLGPLIGDYTRTGIGTRLTTGSCIGTGAMIAMSGYAPKFVERFAFLTDAGPRRYEMDKFIATACKMMARRELALSDAQEARLRSLAHVDRMSRAA